MKHYFKGLYFSMTNKSLLEELFKSSFKDINRLNEGGCGKVALLMSEFLSKNNIPHRIAFVNEGGGGGGRMKNFLKHYKTTSLPNAMNSCSNLVDSGVDVPNNLPFYHIVIKIGNKYFDSTGDVTKNFKFYRKTISSEDLKPFVKLKCWNKTFVNNNSHAKIKHMRKKVKTTFKTLLN